MLIKGKAYLNFLFSMGSYWRRVDEGFIMRGILILILEFVKRYGDEIREVNGGKRGSPSG